MNFSENNIYINTQDYSVSKENFDLLLDEDSGLLKTYPQPNPENLTKYYESEDYISHTDGKRSLFEKTYHIVKSFSLNNKLKIINSFSPFKGKILDIGSGTGDFLVAAQKNGYSTFGFEPNTKAQQIALQKGISFTNQLSDFENNFFDVITMWHVLEHVPDLQKQISELKRLLKPNGTIFIAVPNYKSYDAHYYKTFWAAYDVPRHLWHFSKKAIEIVFKKNQIQLIDIKPLFFDSFYVSLLSEKHKTGKMNFLNAFRIGFLSNWKAYREKEYSSHIYILKNQFP
jgi:2-polyprenyl-3-methyl-5-hydroxy-6-metoxy-1,4-benzoquinol methylase